MSSNQGLLVLNDIYKSRGEEFLNLLFDSSITVTEKIHASRLSFQKIDDKIYIFKKDDRFPISIIDRTLSQYYEKAISHLDEILSTAEVPSNYRFGCEYFINTNPNSVTYSRLPLNNLVLTDIRVYNEDGSIERILSDKDTLNEWAQSLSIEPPPIIFQGRLNANQKVKILEYFKIPYEEAKAKFGGDSFIEHVIKTLNPSQSGFFLDGDFSSAREALIFKFENSTNVFSAKLIDPIMAERIKLNVVKEDDRIPGDIYSITVLDIYYFILERGLKQYSNLKEYSPELRYLELVSSIFNDFYSVYSQKYIDVNFDAPEWMSAKEWEMNKSFIKNKNTLTIINLNKSYEELFKIFIATLRKKKRKPYGFLTYPVIMQLNLIVDEIRTLIDTTIINEASIPFLQFLQESEDPEESTYKIEKKKAIVIISPFQVFTKRLCEIINLAYKETKTPVICVTYSNVPSSKYPIPVIAIKQQLIDIIDYQGVGANREIWVETPEMPIEDLIIKIQEYLDTNIQEIWVDDTDLHEYNIKLKYLSKWKNINIPIKKVELNSDQEICLQYIEEDDFVQFKKIAPSNVVAYFNKLQQYVAEYRKIIYAA